jgi:beta-galactosidase
VVGWEQFVLPGRARPAGREQSTGVVEVEGDLVRAGQTEVRFDLRAGALGGLRWRDDDVVVKGPAPTLWRAPTDNDGLKLFLGRAEGWTDEEAKPLSRWLAWGLDDLRREVRAVTLESEGDLAVFEVDARLHGTDASVEVEHRQTITVFPNGELVFDETVVLPDILDDVARVGVELTVAAGFEHLEWLGLGPWETYPDRRAGATVGRWRSSVDEQLAPYLVPQEHGLHLETRWFALERAATAGLLIAAMEPSSLAFSAAHHTAGDLWRARDLTELSPRAETIVHLDVAHRGVGTLSCGPDALPRYRIAPGTHAWRWGLRAFDPRRERVDAIARVVQTVSGRRTPRGTLAP